MFGFIRTNRSFQSDISTPTFGVDAVVESSSDESSDSSSDESEKELVDSGAFAKVEPSVHFNSV